MSTNRGIHWQSWTFYACTIVIGVLLGKYYLQLSDQTLKSATVRYDDRGKINAVFYWKRDNIGPIAEYPNVAHLDLRNKELDDDAVDVITQLPKMSKLYLGNNQLTDEGVRKLKVLKNLTYLSLSENEGVTDAGLDELHGLSRLRRIDVRQTSVSPQGLRNIRQSIPGLTIFVDPLAVAGLKTLRELGANADADEDYAIIRLDLARTETTDELLRGLASLDRLQMLHLGETLVTDEGLAHLSKLTTLEELWLGDTDITDDGMQHLASLVNLKALSFARTDITGEGFAHLSELKNLTMLNLSDTLVSDVELKHLEALSSLTEIWVSGTDVTNDGVAQLQAALPEVSVLGQEVTQAQPYESHVEPG